jgi:hypothetical protein
MTVSCSHTRQRQSELCRHSGARRRRSTLDAKGDGAIGGSRADRDYRMSTYDFRTRGAKPERVGYLGRFRQTGGAVVAQSGCQYATSPTSA